MTVVRVDQKEFRLLRVGQQYVLTVAHPDGHAETLVLSPRELASLQVAVEPSTH